ncbi:Ig-like domain-containing protein [Ferruginibacter albus]|uniref:Ig-like domain-containing protein n=1 Tax=Ferruginibacter albus TaxID=2875540 RepID=UPI001CC7AE1A|nr:Ig-like domain-containing protein [Ferruginibacter albus]UAY51309.1 Ig-like domain-containing protein [Ferruginibacter albus]
MKRTPTLNLQKILPALKHVLILISTVFCTINVMSQTVPCNQRAIANASFAYTGGGAEPARWDVNQASSTGFSIDQTAYTYTSTGNFSSQNIDWANPNSNLNNSRQYAIVRNPKDLNPQYANIPTDGMMVINPRQGQDDQFAQFQIGNLQPLQTYYVEIKVYNVISAPSTGPGGCNQWCNWNNELKIKWEGNANNAHDGQSNTNWTGSNGDNVASGGWDAWGNQNSHIMRVTPAGSYAILTGQMTLGDKTNGFTFTFYKQDGSSTMPVVLGIDYIKVYGCQQEAINVSGGTTNVCEATEITLTAQGIGSEGSVYSWYKNGTLIPGRTSDTLNVVSAIGPGTQDNYRAKGEWDTASVTLTSKICCSSVGGTSDEVYRQSFNALTYVCPTGGTPDGSRHGGYADIPDKGTKNFIDAAYTYAGSTCNSLNDGQYAVVQSSFAGNYWQNRPEVKDHTGGSGSGALFINATGNVNSVFYKSNFDNLCQNTRYEFTVWYASLATGSETKPSMEFAIYNGATKVDAVQTGVIPANEQWYEASVTFVTPSTGSPTYTLQVTNLVGSASAGNDLMIDDIVVKKCTPSINLYHSGTKDTALSTCSNTPVPLKVTTFYDLPLAITGSSSGVVYYQWMSASSPNGPWTNIGNPERTGVYSATPTTTTTYYRAKVSSDSVRAANGQPPLASECGNDGMTYSFKLVKGQGNLNPAATGGGAFCPGGSILLFGNPDTGDEWKWMKGSTFSTATVIPGRDYSDSNQNKGYSKIFVPGDEGNYYFVAKNADGCEAYASVTVIAYPVPNISGPTTVCQGGSIQLTETTGAIPATVNPWTSSPVLTASVDNTGKVTSQLLIGDALITFRNSNGCQDTLTIWVNAIPTISGTTTVTAGSTSQLTGDGTPAASAPWTSSNTGVATIDNTGKVSAIAAGTTTITYTNSNGCQKTVTVTVTTLPTITGNLSVCLNKTTQLTGSPTAAASNAWVSSNTSVATISNSGLVTAVSVGTSKIIYTNSNADTVSAVVTVNDLPTITGTLAVSTGSTSQLTGSPTAAASNAWVSSNTSVATVSNTGLVSGLVDGTTTITYTNSNGCTTTAVVSVSSSPIISGKLTVCVNGTTKLSATTSPATPTAWSSSDLTVATIDNTGLVSGKKAGTTTITYLDAAGNDTTATVTVNDLPVISGSQNVCAQTSTTYTASGTPAATNPWSTSDASIASINQTNGKILALKGGAVTITYTDINGCSAGLPVTVNALPLITGNAELCQNSTTQLASTATAAASNAWVSSNGGVASVSNAGLVTAISTGTTIITYTDNNTCTDTMQVTVDAIPSAPTGTPTQPSCTTATGSITVTSPASGVTYSFDNGNSYQASATVGNLLPNTYQLVVKSIAGGCISSSQSVTINQPPVIPQAPAANITQTSCTSATGTIAASSTTPNVEYSFDNGATFQPGGTSSALVAGTYQVLVKEISGGCVSTATTAIINTQPTAPADPQLNIVQPTCTNTNGFITVVNAQNNATYSFDNGVTYQTSATSGALSQGNYQVIGKSNAGGCLSNAAPAPINAPPAIPPAPTVGNNGIVKYCQQDLAQPLTANGTNLTWYNSFGASIGTTAPTPLTDQGGSTTYYVTSSNGICESPRTGITVTVSAVSAYAGGPVVAVEEGKSARLNGQASGTGTLTISWSPATYLNRTDIDTPTVTPLKDKLYTMKVTTADGCSDTSSVQVLILKIPVIPNAFSPNGDGINDKWVITNLEGYEGSTVSIFNRYGQLLYEVAGLSYSNNAWDGTVHGNPVPVGTYYYIIKLVDGKKPISGSISVIR